MNAREAARVCAIVLLAASAIAGAQAAAPRFSVSGTATFSADAPAQRGGRYQLRAHLSSQVPGPAVAAPALVGGPYTLSALASASSLVCYDDTIFRDDFDGDGF